MQQSDLPAWVHVHPRETLTERGLWASASRGQNFLVPSDALDRIVEEAQVRADETVLEIGTGLGRLTVRLALHARSVVSVELDGGLYEVARTRLGDRRNIALLNCDFLESKHRINPDVTESCRRALEGVERPLKVVSNLPYSISSPALANLLEWELEPAHLYVTLQEEVGDRITAAPGSEDYGPLTVYVNYWARCEVLFPLGRGLFWPMPAVSSLFLHVRRRPERERTERYPLFAATVRKLFTSRRKTVGRALRLAWDRETAEKILSAVGVDPELRVESLRTGDFEAIAAAAPGPPGD
ncbi:MAG: 16S rRNA (adenine(1518)-N(6)/adenine(1519)-N(6))-dimethyltransferase RsmA [Candidatus Brocadiaceae bacterium]|jgi:16S rRNA (adenine1518-N6/adenine1519-N6)-dimethyltransferase